MTGLDLPAGEASAAMIVALAATNEMIDAIRYGDMAKTQSAAERLERQANAAAIKAHIVARLAREIRTSHRRVA